MGMFNTVRTYCPYCGEILEFQSKVGECSLEIYPLSKVPISIAEDLEDEICFCESCKKRYQIFPSLYLKYVSMSLMEV